MDDDDNNEVSTIEVMRQALNDIDELIEELPESPIKFILTAMSYIHTCYVEGKENGEEEVRGMAKIGFAA